MPMHESPPFVLGRDSPTVVNGGLEKCSKLAPPGVGCMQIPVSRMYVLSILPCILRRLAVAKLCFSTYNPTKAVLKSYYGDSSAVAAAGLLEIGVMS